MHNPAVSGGRQPHRYRAHKKYPFCRVCGYARSERLMHPAQGIKARSDGMRSSPAEGESPTRRDAPEDLLTRLSAAEAERDALRVRAERAEILCRLLADAQPTIARHGDEIVLYCPDGTITDDLYDVLEAALASPDATE